MKKLLPLIVLILAGCSHKVVTPRTGMFDACRQGCSDLGSLMKTPACLIKPSVIEQIGALIDWLHDDTQQMTMPAGACGCLIATVDTNGGISRVETVETNAPEVAAFVAHSIKNLPPAGPIADCLVGMNLPVVFPTTFNMARDISVGTEAFRSGDYELALEELKPLAVHGDARAQLYLGSMYEMGKGVTQDYREAMRWYSRAAARGHPFAQTNIGHMYQLGLGVPVNYEKAMDWYRLAADKGDVGSQLNIGYMYQSGLGVSQSYEDAADWYRLAARRGDGIAQFNLGYLYFYGKGVTKDRKSAHMYFSLALAHCEKRSSNNPIQDRLSAAGCHEEANRGLEIVAEEMSKNEIQEAKKMAAKWWAATPGK